MKVTTPSQKNTNSGQCRSLPMSTLARSGSPGPRTSDPFPSACHCDTSLGEPFSSGLKWNRGEIRSSYLCRGKPAHSATKAGRGASHRCVALHRSNWPRQYRPSGIRHPRTAPPDSVCFRDRAAETAARMRTLPAGRDMPRNFQLGDVGKHLVTSIEWRSVANGRTSGGSIG